MPGYTVKVDSSDLQRAAKGYRVGAKLVDVAVVRSMNRGLDGGLVQVRKDLVNVTGITDKDTRRSKGLTKQLATVGRPTAKIIARSSYTPLAYFRPSPGAAGVTASPWNRTQVFPGTFQLRMSSGYVGVFKRDTTASRQSVTTRSGKTINAQPIKELWGPSMAVEMLRNDIPEHFARVSSERTMARLPTEIDFALNKAMGQKVRK